MFGENSMERVVGDEIVYYTRMTREIDVGGLFYPKYITVYTEWREIQRWPADHVMQSLLENGNLTVAKQYFDQAYSGCPDGYYKKPGYRNSSDATNLAIEAQQYLNGGNFALARTKFNEAYNLSAVDKVKNLLNPIHQAEILNQRGVATEDATIKIQCYTQASGLCPNNLVYHCHKAYALNLLSSYEEAIRSADVVLSVEPNNQYAKNEKAKALNSKGVATEDAAIKIQCYTQASELCPDNLIYHCHKAYAFNLLGNYEEAIRSADVVLSVEPNNQYAKTQKDQASTPLKLQQISVIGIDVLYPVGWMPYLGDWKNALRKGGPIFRYYDPAEIDGVGIIIGKREDGKFYGNNLKAAICEEIIPYSKSAGHYSWVLEPTYGKIMYVWNPNAQIETGTYIRHSNLNAGKPVICAGEFYITPLGISELQIEVNDRSGHYKPDGHQCIKYVLEQFVQLGMATTENTQFYEHCSPSEEKIELAGDDNTQHD